MLSGESRAVGEPQATLIDGLLALHSISLYISLMMMDGCIVKPAISLKLYTSMSFFLFFFPCSASTPPPAARGLRGHTSPTGSHHAVFAMTSGFYEKCPRSCGGFSQKSRQKSCLLSSSSPLFTRRHLFIDSSAQRLLMDGRPTAGLREWHTRRHCLCMRSCQGFKSTYYSVAANSSFSFLHLVLF